MINETQAISRVVAFSDYRVQDVDLLIEYLRSLNPPPDLILYAGDDIDRFGPLPEDFLRRRVESAKRLAQGDLRGTDVRDMYLFKVKPIGSGKDRVVKGIARSTWTHCHISRLIRERLNNFESEGTVNVADLKEAVESVFKELGSSGVEFSTGQGSLVMPRTELKSIHLEVNSDLFEGRISAYLGVSSPVKFIVDSDWLRLARRETDPETFTSVDQVLHGLLGKAVVIPSSSNGKESSGILYFPTEHRNLFELLATLTKYGLCGVIGNDDNSHVRDLIVGRKVFNVHNVPVIIGSYAIIGQEAAPIKPDQPNPGIILYDENSIAKHLENFLPHVEGKKLIVVSHAPPLEVLDHALRFGESNIGSQSLREFVENHKNVKMVVSGHVHYCGGKTANLSDALIVNAASHDSYGEPGKVAVIDIDQQGGLAVHWHLIHELPGIFGIGPKISTRLKSSGIRAVEHMLATPLQEICAKTGYSQRTVEKWMIRAKAIVEGRVYPLSRFVPPPPPRIYVDIETDLAQSVIWLVGVYSEARSEYGCFFASSPKEEKGILLDFLEFVKRQPNSTICSFSGSNFDGRVLKQRLEAHKLNSSATGRIVDLYQPILKSVALPLKSYGLKSLGRFFRYDYKHPNIDGFDIAIMYFNQYLKSKDEKLRQIFEEYNRDDVLILPQLIRSLVELTSDPR